MNKTIIRTALTAILTLLLPAAAIAYDFEAGGIYYNVKDGQAEVTHNGQTKCYSGDIVIPAIVTNGDSIYQVVSIGDKAFMGCSDLSSIVFPDNLRRIGYEAFYQCKKLTSVIIPDSVTSIGGYAFSACSAVENLSMGQSVTTIGGHAFEGCSLVTDIILPDALTTIGDCAFFSCTGLPQLTIPNGVTSIGVAAFQKCTAMASLSIPESVTNIGSGAFTYNSGLKSLVFNAVNCMIKGSIFGECPIDTITLGDRVKYIPDYLASGLTKLRSITIPDSVIVIGTSAFENCSGLTSVVFPESLNVIGYDAFSGCKALRSIVIPNSVTTINARAFFLCSSLDSIVIGNAVTKIGEKAFGFCKITSITIPNSVITIDDFAFDDCSQLDSVTLGNSVARLGNSIFYGCNQLKNLTCLSVAPPEFDKYYYGLFDDQGLYSRVTLHVLERSVEAYQSARYWANFTQILGDVTDYTPRDGYGFDFIVDGIYYNVIDGGVEVTNDGNLNWDGERTYSGDVVIPEQVTHDGMTYSVLAIGKKAFYGCTGLNHVTIPNSAVTIGDQAFYWCQGLTSVTIPNSVTTIGNDAFHVCAKLESVVIGDGVTSIGNSSFADCYVLKDVVFGNSVTTIERGAFIDCPALPSITVPNSVTTIGGSAFAHCSSLVSATIGSSVTSIGRLLFYDSDQLKDLICLAITPPEFSEPEYGLFNEYGDSYSQVTLHVPSKSLEAYQSATYWKDFSNILGDAATDGKDIMVDGICYHVEDGQATVTNNGQTGCYSGDIVIPETITHDGTIYQVTAIGDSAFKNCTALTSIAPPNSIATIGISAFENCTGLTSITIPEAVTLIYSPAFDGCTGVKTLFFNAINYKYALSFRKLPIETLVLGEHVQLVPACLMGHCKQLTSVIFSNSLTTIDVGAFQNCTALTQLNFPPSLTTIEGYAFDGCTGLTSLTIPDAVTRIANSAFSSCKGLSDIHFGNSVATIGNDAFLNCSGLTTVNLPNSVTSIGKYAFKGCSSITSVAMGSNVASIGNMMVFSGCDQLTSLTCLAAEPPTIGSEGNSLESRYYDHTTVHVLPGLVEAYQSAPYWYWFAQILGDATDGDNPGDVNGDGEVNVSDANKVIDVIINGGGHGHNHAPTLEGETGSENNLIGDVNGDGKVNISDLNAVIEYIINN